ncbi:hypothetical protein ABE425_06285 [Chryseobacterium cucumeris]
MINFAEAGLEIIIYGLNKQFETTDTILVFRKDGPQSRALSVFMHSQVL